MNELIEQLKQAAIKAYELSNTDSLHGRECGIVVTLDCYGKTTVEYRCWTGRDFVNGNSIERMLESIMSEAKWKENRIAQLEDELQKLKAS